MKEAEFKWGKLSPRQMKILTWWTDDSPYKDYNGIIADGAIRSGKTVSMAFSFVLWAMTRFNGYNFAICGKTVGSCRRNVITVLKRQLRSRGYSVRDMRSDNVLTVTKGTQSNLFYIFGGKDEASQDLVQGITLAGAFFDEVALMPMSFVNQTTGRCSVTGSKFWFNCNPGSPQHWFYLNWIKQCRALKMLYLHFTMEDNLTLSEDIVDRYKAMYAGVFFNRYILGQWVTAEGLIYDMWNPSVHVLKEEPETEGHYYISADFGIQNATVFLLWRREVNSGRWICLREAYYSGRDNHVQKTVAELVEDMKSIIPVNESTGEMIYPKQVIVDPSAAALITEMRRQKFHVLPAKNEVLDGISDVSTMLRQNRIAFTESCRSTINEFGIYAWDAKAAERGVDAPIKSNDHAMDAIRYAVRTLRWVSKKEPYGGF